MVVVTLQGVEAKDGSGECTCDKGYTGDMCGSCDTHFFKEDQEEDEEEGEGEGEGKEGEEQVEKELVCKGQYRVLIHPRKLPYKGCHSHSFFSFFQSVMHHVLGHVTALSQLTVMSVRMATRRMTTAHVKVSGPAFVM